jgi:hypothetical protein
LWERYQRLVPPARTFVALAGGHLRNDHVAFRSIARPGDGIELLAPPFERLGWRRAGIYLFPDAHLAAIHLSHPDGLPRLFLSQIDPAPLGGRAARILGRMDPALPPPDDPAALAAWLDAPAPWLDGEELAALEAASQYAAWVALFGRSVNHFTAAVDDVEAWQARLAAAGVAMKARIEGERGGPLRQTTTVAAEREVELSDGSRRSWPYAYLEIAQRAAGFDGFLAPQARQLFEQTRRA